MKGEATTSLTQWGGKQICAYDVSVASVNHRTRAPELLIAPTDIVAYVMTAVTGLPLVKLLNNEVRPGIVIMRPTKGNEHYRHVAHAKLVASINDARELSPQIHPDRGVWRWQLKRQGIGEGRNWYLTHFVWISAHPSVKPKNLKLLQDEANAIARAMETERVRK